MSCVVVLSVYIPAGPIIFTKLQPAVATVAVSTRLDYFNQSQPNHTDHANGSTQGHHLHWSSAMGWYQSHACVWPNSIKGQVYLTFCSLSG